MTQKNTGLLLEGDFSEWPKPPSGRDYDETDVYLNDPDGLQVQVWSPEGKVAVFGSLQVLPSSFNDDVLCIVKEVYLSKMTEREAVLCTWFFQTGTWEIPEGNTSYDALKHPFRNDEQIVHMLQQLAWSMRDQIIELVARHAKLVEINRECFLKRKAFLEMVEALKSGRTFQIRMICRAEMLGEKLVRITYHPKASQKMIGQTVEFHYRLQDIKDIEAELNGKPQLRVVPHNDAVG